MLVDTSNLHHDWQNNEHMLGHVYFARQNLKTGLINFGDFVDNLLLDVLRGMIRNNFEQPLPEAMRTYCNLAMVDSKLVEIYIGMPFERINFQAMCDDINAMLVRTGVSERYEYNPQNYTVKCYL